MLRLLPVFLLIGCSDYGFTPEQPVERPPADIESVHEEPIPGEPVADAGPDVFTKPLSWVDLDGTNSYDPDELYPLSYSWRLVSKPSESQSELVDRTSPTPRFFPDVAGEFVFELEVANADGVWSSQPDTVSIYAEPTDGFYVQLTWDNHFDLDLHLMRSGGVLYRRPGDCNYCNMNPNWGTASPLDDPSLDTDEIYGYGPETITIEEPYGDEYTIAVKFYGESGSSSCIWNCEPTRATVRLFMDGVETHSWTRTLNEAGEVWEVARVNWPSTAVNDLDTVTTTSLSYCF
ncbi:MAG: hypothetical protein EA397_18960 [Deltaproteobacteria bacterium]|nr:MAG: hypothetical protein EA397_18960 [Deltaproteobacteria bacterium]